MYELNLLPYQIKQKRQKHLKNRQYIVYAVIALCLLSSALYIPHMIEWSLNAKELKLKEQIEKNSKILAENKSINQETEELKSYIEKVKDMTSRKVIAGDRIRNLEKYVPSDVILENLNYTKGTITINGNAQNYNSISEFVASLQTTDNYRDARITNIIYNPEQSRYLFSISISYTREERK